jgi:pyruvate formate lyase activating enzyme
VPYECRTTWHAGLFGLEELEAMGQTLRDFGVTQWVVQECRSDHAPSWHGALAHTPWPLTTKVRRA